jgi:hypothetical protein
MNGWGVGIGVPQEEEPHGSADWAFEDEQNVLGLAVVAVRVKG